MAQGYFQVVLAFASSLVQLQLLGSAPASLFSNSAVASKALTWRLRCSVALINTLHLCRRHLDRMAALARDVLVVSIAE